jgi:hypothetical protein
MLDNRIVEINSKWQLLYDEMKEEIVDMQQYIKNGIEFGYIDDREDDYNKFFQCNNKTLEERKEQLNKSIENAKMITKEDEMEELIKRNYIKREM